MQKRRTVVAPSVSVTGDTSSEISVYHQSAPEGIHKELGELPSSSNTPVNQCGPPIENEILVGDELASSIASEVPMGHCVQTTEEIHELVESAPVQTSNEDVSNLEVALPTSVQPDNEPPNISIEQPDTGKLKQEIEALKSDNMKLKQELVKSKFSVESIAERDKLTNFYTGLRSWRVFHLLYVFLSASVPPGQALSLMDELFLVLIKLRLNLMVEDLATRFQIGTGTVSRIFHKWLSVMYVSLKFLIVWPPRELIEQNMPSFIKSSYPKCRCIIDCSEIFIERPSSYDARAQTYSNYKKHNTVKFLIAITPRGAISFISECWGGRVSDKNITQESKFLNLLDPCDVVLADRGFLLQDDFAIHGARLEIPAFTRGKTQLSQSEIESSKQLSHVRIHIERAIGLLKNKYTILKSILPITLMKHDSDGIAIIDKILTICCALVNLSEPIVTPEEFVIED